MATSISKSFWNTTTDQYNSIAKIVFTSPNIDSPALAGTRSHILPGGRYIATWFEAVDYMHRIKWNENAPDKQATYFAKLSMGQDEPFNFNMDTSITVISDYPVAFQNGDVIIYGIDTNNDSEYCVVNTAVSGSITTFGGQLLGFVKENIKHGGCIFGDGTSIYRATPLSNDIYLYNTTKNLWDVYLQAPDDFGEYASIIKVGTKLYCVKGTSDRVFWEYDMISFIWTNLYNLPVDADDYNFINSFDDDNLIYFLKAGDSTLYEYNATSNTWDSGTTLSLSGHDEVKFGPALWKYDSKYYTWSAVRDGTTTGIRYLEIEPSTGIATDKGLYKEITTASGSGVDFVSFGKDTTCSGLYGTGISTLGHYNLNDTDNEFLYSLHDVTLSGIDMIHNGNYSAVECFDNPEDLSFPAAENINPDIASITTISGSDDFYFLDRKNDFVDAYFSLYTLVPSGIAVNCDTSYSFLAGESSDTIYTNLTVISDDVYLIEGVYSNSMWKYNSTAETWAVNELIALKDDGDDRKFVTKAHAFILTDSTDLFLLKGDEFNTFYKHTVVSGSWTQLADMPGVLSEYSQGVYVSSNNSVYVIQGKDSSALWRYDVAGNSWSIEQGAPSSFTSNCGLHYPIWGGDYIYASRGRGYGHFWRYKISTDEWFPLTGLLSYTSLITGLTSRGTEDSNGKIYSIDNVSVTEYRGVNDVWITVPGYLSYNDLEKTFASSINGANLYVVGNAGLRKYEIDNLVTISEQTKYDIDFSSVVGTSIVSVTDYFNVWKNNLSNDAVWAHAKNSIIFEATNGESYGCRLTAWDDDTHTTTSNLILNGGHYRATCTVYKSINGTKTDPLSGNNTEVLVHPVGVDKVLKGNDSYYGDFEFVHIANGGPSGQEHGQYLIFLPRLAGIDDTFAAGNYDFITTFHYSYT